MLLGCPLGIGRVPRVFVWKASDLLDHSLSLANLGRETSLDGSDGTSGTAAVAGNEVQSVLSLVELGVGAAAGLASNVFDCDHH